MLLQPDRQRPAPRSSAHHGDPATLAQLFRGELWRGRDNLRASLRGRVTLRAVPGIAIPLLDLACLAALVGGVATAPNGGLLVAAPAAGVLAMFAALRAARMLAHRPAPRPGDVVRALIVAGVYDVARSLALVTRTPHWRRRRSLDRVGVR